MSRPELPPPNPLLMATLDDNPAVPLCDPPAAPAAKADLREQIEDLALWYGIRDSEHGEKFMTDLLALPALQRLVAEAAETRRLRETVARVRALVAAADQLSETGNPAVRGWQTPAMRTVVRDLRRALDGTDG